MNIFVHTGLFILGVLLYLVLLYYNSVMSPYGQIPTSSVTCVQTQSGHRSCHFTNLFYSVNHGFLFVLSNSSVVYGLDSYDDLKSLIFAPIKDNTAVRMKLTVAKRDDLVINHWQHIGGDFLGVYRFKPDNIMHVVHDDLIPLFMKYRELCFGNVSQCSHRYKLFFVDANEGGPYLSWYKALTTTQPIFSGELPVNKSYCFDSFAVGVANTYFFQYGFKKPHGPLSTTLSKTDVIVFREYFLKKLGVMEYKRDYKTVSLISRSVNRKIVNEDYLLHIISMHLGVASKVKLLKFDMILNDTREILHSVSSSSMLIGMHGAETVLSLFLPDCSVFVELFPYGIIEKNVSPISSLSKIPSIHFKYFAWHNTVENNSIPHPEYPRIFGGISEFSDDLQSHIINTKSIPAVECCDNPYYLFRMYQDTIIDHSFSEVIKQVSVVLNEERCDVTEDVFSLWLFPGPVRNLTCILHPTYTLISWDVPFNMITHIVTYNVTVQIGTKPFQRITNELYLKLVGNNSVGTQVWVSSHYNGMFSVDMYSKCV